MKGLKQLTLDSTDFTAAGIPALNELDLAYLGISHTAVDGQDLTRLSRLRKLQGLEVGPINNISQLLKALRGSGDLEMLCIDSTSIGKSDISDIALIPHLKYLFLAFDKFSEADLRPLAEMPNLRTVVILGSKLSPECMSLFSRAKSGAMLINESSMKDFYARTKKQNLHMPVVPFGLKTHTGLNKAP
jgi:hypothetical protein